MRCQLVGLRMRAAWRGNGNVKLDVGFGEMRSCDANGSNVVMDSEYIEVGLEGRGGFWTLLCSVFDVIECKGYRTVYILTRLTTTTTLHFTRQNHSATLVDSTWRYRYYRRISQPRAGMRKR